MYVVITTKGKGIDKMMPLLLKELEEEELIQIEAAGCLRRGIYEKGAVIFRTGEVVHELGIVISGSVNIENVDFWGDKSILSNISSGQIFAESYAISGKAMLVDATAAEACEILFMDLSFLMKNENLQKPWRRKVMDNLLQAAVRKNMILSNRIFCTSSKTVRGRVLTYLSEVSVQEGSTTFQIPFNRQQMADYLNLDRSALSKELGKMQKEGLLIFCRNTFTLLV